MQTWPGTYVLTYSETVCRVLRKPLLINYVNNYNNYLHYVFVLSILMIERLRYVAAVRMGFTV